MLPRFGSADAPIAPILGRPVTVFGFGNQGRAQALNLKDSGVDVRVALRPDSAHSGAVRAAGLECVDPGAGARRAEVAALLVPDDAIPGLVETLAGEWHTGVTFVLAHSAAAARAEWKLPVGARVACVAPAAPGVELRSKYEQGGGVTAFLALSDARDESLRALGLAYGAAIGCARAGIFECTFAQEMGVVVPPIRLRDNLQMGANEYRFLLKGNSIAQGSLMPGYWLAMNATNSRVTKIIPGSSGSVATDVRLEDVYAYPAPSVVAFVAERRISSSMG